MTETDRSKPAPDEPLQSASDRQPEPHATEDAYIVIRDDSRWRDVFRLIPGHCLTIGRERVNRVVLDDDRVSRRHCEIFFGPGGWLLNDLGSSNGTQLNGQRISGRVSLKEGDLIWVGASELLFTCDITQPLGPGGPLEGDTSLEETKAADDSDDDADQPEILEQRSRSRYRNHDSADLPRPGVLAGLYRLVSNMAGAQDQRALAGVVLDGLFETLTPDIGAVLLLEEPCKGEATATDLRLISFRAPDDKPYHRPSDRLSTVALRNGSGTLAMVMGNGPETGAFQTLESMNARSVICAPIRQRGIIYGLVHLYSLQPERALDSDALEFVLAVTEHMAETLSHMKQQQQLTRSLELSQDEARSLRRMLAIESDLIGDSQPMVVLRDEIARFAVTDSTALIRGESGVGKELVARAIHFNSKRREGPFVCLNCAALSETLLESELFGHERGAFTGAIERKIGRFEQADGGTLFLDEVGEMSQQIQAKFLRVLEGHPFERIGGTKTVNVNVRVVAATNRELEQAIRDGEFRRDLYFRLNILDITVPPLRERRDDIERLAEHLMKLCAQRAGRSPRTFSGECLQAMKRYEWPGNVRELRNTIERAFAICQTPEITMKDLRFSSLEDGTTRPSPRDESDYQPLSLKDVERDHIAATMEFTSWVKREAARILEIERSTLDRKLKTYGIDRPED